MYIPFTALLRRKETRLIAVGFLGVSNYAGTCGDAAAAVSKAQEYVTISERETIHAGAQRIAEERPRARGSVSQCMVLPGSQPLRNHRELLSMLSILIEPDSTEHSFIDYGPSLWLLAVQRVKVPGAPRRRALKLKVCTSGECRFVGKCSEVVLWSHIFSPTIRF
ncbi:hypothetical protein BC834DRAFT_40912 [Gloeopeniophorella convolvens]|nr:hypothetical protein BC834DRAFT_40912 [Gloeopeniophorella convolvens]